MDCPTNTASRLPDTPFLAPRYEAAVRDVRARRRRFLIPESPLFRGELRPYQHDGVTVMYLTPRLILGDVTGLGKTVMALRYLVYLRERGELSRDRPALVVCEPKAYHDTWLADGFRAFTPDLLVAPLHGEVLPRDRHRVYREHWPEVYLLNYPIFLRDHAHLMRAYPGGFASLVCDEASVMKNHKTRTAEVVKLMGQRTSRTVLLSATPIQNELVDIHSLLEGLQLHRLVGTKRVFERNYLNTHVVQRVIPGGDTIHVRERDRHVPYRNLDQLKELIWPYYFRRGYRDVPGEMPELSWSNEWVDLTRGQALVYEALRKQNLPNRDQAYSFNLRHRALNMKKTAVSLQTLQPDAVDESSKLDWLVAHLRGDWSEGDIVTGGPVKVVVYSTWKDTILTAVRRLEAEGIGYVVFSGLGDLPGGRPWVHGTTPRQRSDLRQRFFTDPSCQVLFGTTAIDMGLNLQAAPVLVNLDLPTNPGRALQIAGRIWRQNSQYRFVHVINLLTIGTLEVGQLRLLEARAELIDTMNGESAEGLFGGFTNEELERLVTQDWRS